MQMIAGPRNANRHASVVCSEANETRRAVKRKVSASPAWCEMLHTEYRVPSSRAVNQRDRTTPLAGTPADWNHAFTIQNATKSPNELDKPKPTFATPSTRSDVAKKGRRLTRSATNPFAVLPIA